MLAFNILIALFIFLLLKMKDSLLVLETACYQKWELQVFSLGLVNVLSFYSLNSLIQRADGLNFDEIQFIILSFFAFTFAFCVCVSKKVILKSQGFLLDFLLSVLYFQASYLFLWASSASHIIYIHTQFLQHHLLTDNFSLLKCLCTFEKLIDSKCMDLILNSVVFHWSTCV